MSIALLFWVCYLVSLILTLWTDWPVAPGALRPAGGRLLGLLLLGLLGWQVFGAAVHR